MSPSPQAYEDDTYTPHTVDKLEPVSVTAAGHFEVRSDQLKKMKPFPQNVITPKPIKPRSKKRDDWIKKRYGANYKPRDQI